jgi:hypothetical protein
MAASYEHGDEPSGSMKGDDFLDELMNCQRLGEDSVAWS